MKAIRVHQFGDPSVMVLEEAPEPVPASGQVLVRLHAAGVNPVETYIRSGKYARLPQLPYTPGTDGAGMVEQSEDAAIAAGARVFVVNSMTGTYAEKTLCEAGQVYPLPDRVSFEQGAAVGVPYATATWALFYRGQARAGETLLVHGASGGVGTAALQLARAAGMRVFGTAGTPEGLELVLRNGAEAAFNHREPGYLDKIKAATGDGPNIILEMAANKNLAHDLGLIAMHGRVVVIGSRGSIEIDPRAIMARNADIRGVMFASAPLAEIYRRISDGLADGSLNPVIGTRLPLGEAARAHEQILSSSARGKMILTM
ncbi:MAG: NADPH:quinone reductase [Chthoniobacteraceae bacterium]|jgi:NADPH2:quinone reductase